MPKRDLGHTGGGQGCQGLPHSGRTPCPAPDLPGHLHLHSELEIQDMRREGSQKNSQPLFVLHPKQSSAAFRLWPQCHLQPVRCFSKGQAPRTPPSQFLLKAAQRMLVWLRDPRKELHSAGFPSSSIGAARVLSGLRGLVLQMMGPDHQGWRERCSGWGHQHPVLFLNFLLEYSWFTVLC